MLHRKNIRIVLVETSHPGNIGATARAMKTMGQANLYLVNPKTYPHADCTARAAGADDVLQNAVLCHSLEEALKDCALIFATTARDRSISWPVEDPRQCADTINNAAAESTVAIVFGRERSGLKNEEIDLCNRMVQIPANKEYSSLNLASAVQILCYEILMHSGDRKTSDHEDSPLATHEEMEGFYQHLIETMTNVGFYDPQQPKQLQRRLKRLFNRVQMEQTELNILRGFFSAVQDKMKK